MSRTCRVVSILCLVAFLALPLMAQPQKESNAGLLDFLSSVWERITGTVHGTGPVTSAWAADGSDPLPVPTPTPSPSGDGRGGWDPNG